MSYDSVEPSVQSSRPRFLYTFTVNGVVTRLCSGDRDRSVGGNVYSAATITHTSITKSPLGRAKEVFVSMPRTHPLALELIGGGLAPDTQYLLITKYHEGDGEIRQVWDGDISGGEIEGPNFKIRIPSWLDDLMTTKLPILVAQRECINVVGDTVCTVNLELAAYKVTTTISDQTGRTLTVASIGGKPDGHFDRGKVYAASGEKRSIVSQVGTTIVIDVPFRTPLGACDLYAGCDQLPETCVTKFANIDNFAGAPAMPLSNPTAPNWIGFADSV